MQSARAPSGSWLSRLSWLSEQRIVTTFEPLPGLILAAMAVEMALAGIRNCLRSL